MTWQKLFDGSPAPKLTLRRGLGHISAELQIAAPNYPIHYFGVGATADEALNALNVDIALHDVNPMQPDYAELASVEPVGQMDDSRDAAL